jgi:hypothetical protein
VKEIKSFDDCVHYIHRLGIITGCNIADFQEKICNICDRILNVSGNKTWYHLEFKPFKVEFNRASKSFKIFDEEGVVITIKVM